MIIKTLPKYTSNYRDLIRYVLTDGGKENPYHSFTCFNNLRGIDQEVIAAQFKDNAKHIHARGKVKGYHEIISWHPDSEKHLTEDKLRLIAEKYIELRGASGLCIAKPHYSTSHPHVHFVFSPMDYHKKKSLRLDNYKFYGIRKELEQFQKELIPEITTEVYQHFGTNQPLKSKTKKHLSHKEYRLVKRKNKKNTTKDYLKETINQILEFSESIGQAQDQLKKVGIEFYQRNGMTKGLNFKNKSYRFTTLQIQHPSLKYLNRVEELNKISRQKTKSKSLER